jgi:NAD(P)-dependent dehydrogenase (short-subunit alcohol dehydrogenase family)
MSGKLAGSVAWISGGASGMGAASARQGDRGESLVAEISATGARVLYTPCDVASEVQVRESIDRAAAEFGGLQIVLNCAGIVHVKLLHEYTEREWDELMGINVKSIFFSIKHAIAHFKKHRRSYMVNIGSIGSFIGQACTPAYSTSKGAVLQLTKGIALDYAAIGLRANCVCPGITDTPMLRYHLSTTPDPEATLAMRLRRVPTGVALSPHDIAKALLYLSCEDSSGVTGTSLVVDGGYLAAAEWNTAHDTAFKDPI